MALEDIAGYSLRRKLGSGSAGTVWLVRDRASGRNAVLKRVPTTAVTDPDEFRKDLGVLQRIHHPHLARLQEFRETGTEWLLVSQYVVAGTLSALLGRRGPLTDGELVTLLSPLGDALDHLHRAGLAHGRVTAANIMFDADGRPVLTDAAIHPSSPTDDLDALAVVAHHSGGDPAIYTPELFTHHHDLLTIATPIPINLAFTTDPPSPPPKPSTSDDSIQRSRDPNPLSRLVSPPMPARAGDARPVGVVPGSGPISTPARPSRPVRRRTRRRTWRRRRFARPAPIAALRRFHHPAYGLLTAVGLGAVVVLILGLITVGALDKPTDTAAATDHPTQPASTPAAVSPTPAAVSPTRQQPSTPPGGFDAAKWTQTLQALDTQRAQAFWTLDLALLDRIYVPGSDPWAADRALLTSYRKHQVRIRGLQIRITKTTVESQTPTTVILRATDHLTAGEAITATGPPTQLPPAPPTTRRITLSTAPTSPTWRIATITRA